MRSGTAGRATIAGHEVTFPIVRDSVRFALANRLGRFRGKWAAGRRTIEGFWVQPPGVPIGLEQPYASAMTLEPADTGGGFAAVQRTARQQRPEIRLDAAFSRTPGRIRIFWPDLLRTIDLTRPAILDGIDLILDGASAIADDDG